MNPLANWITRFAARRRAHAGPDAVIDAHLKMAFQFLGELAIAPRLGE